jgi:hypothetical protein
MMRANTGRIVTSAAAITTLLLLAGCQVSQSAQSVSPSQSASIVVTITPGSASVQTGMPYQFSASVQGDSANKGVTWSIPSSPGCDCGTIDSTGKYVASNTTHTTGLAILATSVSDPTKSATAIVYVTPASSQSAISVTVSPGSVSVQSGMSVQFSASVQGDSTNKGVTWSIPPSPGCDCGTIDSTGKYLAPNTAHTAPGVIIAATSVSDPTKSGTAVILVTSAPIQIAVTITPPNASVQVGATLQFSASVQGDPANRGVTWSIQSSGCDCGTIDSTGKYFAPQTPHDAAGIVITATSMSDHTKSATAVVSVTPAPDGIGVFPTIAVVPVKGVQQFGATGTPFLSDPVVTWTVAGTGCVAAGCGTIDANGNYTAPATIPVPASVRIAATSAVDASVAGYADVSIGSPDNDPDNLKLSGHYAFLLKGYSGDGSLDFAGSFIADGKGNISGGVGDLTSIDSGSVGLGVTFTGNYTVSPDNRASITITSSASWMTGMTFTISLASFDQGVADRGRVTEVDSIGIWTTGLLARQDPTAFSTNAVSGGYAFGFGGTAYSGSPLETAGRFTASAGLITAGYADVYGDGLAQSGAGTVLPEPDLPFSGIYTVSSNGRGTASLNGLPYSNFAFYVISSDELLFIELEGGCGYGVMCRDFRAISGTALRQSGGPFSAALLKGTSVFDTEFTLSATQETVAVGVDSFDGNGNVSETRDQNQVGLITTSKVNGTYSVDTNGLGRGIISLSGSAQPRPFYLVSPGKAFVMDLGSYEAGSFDSQAGGSFGNASMAGPYAMGTQPPDLNWVFVPMSGVLTADGTGYLTGTTDSVGGSGININGNYLVGPDGRATMTIVSANGSTANWVFYLVSPSKAVGIGVTPGTVNSAIRVIEK